jgi:hypothetical protein
VLALSVAAGFIVQGNFSNLTSGVLAVAAPRYLGATIGLYSCIGFGASFLGTLLFGVTLDQFGGTSRLAAWAVSFGTCGLACLAGAGSADLAELGRSRSTRRSCPEHQQREKRAQAEAGRDRHHADAHAIDQKAEEGSGDAACVARGRRAENTGAQARNRPARRSPKGRFPSRSQLYRFAEADERSDAVSRCRG